ncbi:MAG: hypothetical protein PVJ09_00615 [Candidatus Woesebacteria bacterium]|jgi:antitoxin (DNA-binding transcriptional repressor) of toxin-antitoxin stability system
MYQTVSIQQTRDNLAEIINKVAIAGERFVVTKFGKVKAMIVPITEQKPISDKKRKAILDEVTGIWQNRKDMKDSDKWLSNLRRPRYEISS